MPLPIRRSAAHTPGKVQNKQRLVDMPYDVLFEIFVLLEPLDLLHLSRTTRALRGFLLSRKKCAMLWKRVIGNVDGFPPCPDHMSAPAYTHLAFVPVCHGCLRPCETVEWELRMRSCSVCFPNMTVPRSIISNTKNYEYLDAVNLPTIRTTGYSLNVSNGLDVFVTVEPAARIGFISRLDWDVARSRSRPENVSMEKFLAEEKESWGSICEHAKLCVPWHLGILQARAAQLTYVRRQRVKDIREKLSELGWNLTFLDCCYEFCRLPEVSKLEPLTSMEWADIQPGLVDWLRNRKWGSKAEELVLAARQLALPPRSDPSRLLSVVFWCKICKRRFRFDEGLLHSHLYSEMCMEQGGSVYDMFVADYTKYSRNIGVLRVDVTASRRVENLIRRMGKNPSRVTYDELRRSTVNMVCRLCHSETGMNCERAFEHCLKAHQQSGETEVWTRMPARQKYLQ